MNSIKISAKSNKDSKWIELQVDNGVKGIVLEMSPDKASEVMSKLDEAIFTIEYSSPAPIVHFEEDVNWG